MVKERRFIFDPEDITAVIYVCAACGQEVQIPVDGKHRPSRQCGSCMAIILDSDVAERLDPREVLLTNLRSVLHLDSTHVKLRFVVPDHDDPDSTR